ITHGERWNRGCRRCRAASESPFLTPKKKQLVPFTIEIHLRDDNGPAQRVSKLVVPKWLRPALRIVRKLSARPVARGVQTIAFKSIRIQRGVSKEFKGAPVQLSGRALWDP